MPPAPIQMTSDYVVTTNYGKGVDFASVLFDAEEDHAHLVLVAVDGNGDAILPKRFVEIEAHSTGARVRKFNGDVKLVPALTYAALKAASDTGAAGLIAAILAQVPADTFPSGT